jgi:predicted RNA binding protein YcfA (HicA-like mRNA interferase family)
VEDEVSEILELLKRDGWYVARMRGSHRQFKHPARAGLVTVAGKPADDLAPGTLKGLREDGSPIPPGLERRGLILGSPDRRKY